VRAGHQPLDESFSGVGGRGVRLLDLGDGIDKGGEIRALELLALDPDPQGFRL